MITLHPSLPLATKFKTNHILNGNKLTMLLHHVLLSYLSQLNEP